MWVTHHIYITTTYCLPYLKVLCDVWCLTLHVTKLEAVKANHELGVLNLFEPNKMAVPPTDAAKDGARMRRASLDTCTRREPSTSLYGDPIGLNIKYIVR